MLPFFVGGGGVSQLWSECSFKDWDNKRTWCALDLDWDISSSIVVGCKQGEMLPILLQGSEIWDETKVKCCSFCWHFVGWQQVALLTFAPVKIQHSIVHDHRSA